MTDMTNFALTVNDIRPHDDNVYSLFNKIRKAWVLQMDPETKAKFSALSQEVRFELYGGIDKDVRDMYIKLLQDNRQNALKAGAQMIKGANDKYTLESQYQIDTDELIIQAANIVVTRS